MIALNCIEQLATKAVDRYLIRGWKTDFEQGVVWRNAYSGPLEHRSLEEKFHIPARPCILYLSVTADLFLSLVSAFFKISFSFSRVQKASRGF